MSHDESARTRELFARVAKASPTALVTAGSDIALVLSEEGVILDIALRDAALGAYAIDDWVGKRFEDTVTPESVDKARRLVEESADAAVTRRRQVNHPGADAPDLPVEYRIVAIEGETTRIALGVDQGRIAEMQRRLVRAQIDLEKDYRRIREAEARYRTIFQISDRPSLIVDGAGGKVIDANRAAGLMFHRLAENLIGEITASLFSEGERGKFEALLSEVHFSSVGKSGAFTGVGDGPPALVAVTPYRENGRNNLLLSIETRPQAEHSGFDISEGALLNSLPEGVVFTDLTGVVKDVNARFMDLIHVLTPDRARGRHLSAWLGASSVDMQVLISKIREVGEVRNFASVVQDEIGNATDVTVSAARHGSEAGEADTITLVISRAFRPDQRPQILNDGGTEDTDFSKLVGRVPLKDVIRDAVDVIEKLCIEAALKQTRNNRASAADLLGLSRQSLYTKLKRYGIQGAEDAE